MCFLFLGIVLWMLKNRMRQFGKGRRQRIWFLIIGYILLMVAYEWYVEYAVGHKYGIPTDDDTRWIFVAATALSDGASVDELMYLTLNNSFDAYNRVLTLNNLGQYLYAFWVYAAVYLPTIFSVRINLFFVYLIQIIVMFICAIDLTNLFRRITSKSLEEEFSFWPVFGAIICCPLLVFNSFKLLRETWYFFFMVQLISKAAQKREFGSLKYVYMYAFMCFLLRPLSLVYFVPLIVYYCFDKHLGKMVALGCLGIMVCGTTLVQTVGRLVGWNYHIGEVSISDIIHFLMFPNIFNQIPLFLEIGDNPSWVTLLYFFQSVWNIVYVVVMLFGILLSGKRHLDRTFWLTMLINCLMIYSIPYNIENLTPRYKLIYFIPMMYFCVVCIQKTKKTIKFSVR